jgi:hypothetical protein
MSQATPAPVPAPMRDQAPMSNPLNAAVQRCCQARDRAIDAAGPLGLDKYQIKERGEQAYRAVLPHLSGYENIRDFIACISHGAITGDIHPIEAPGLLYAAQVAISALRLQPKDPKDKKTRAA